MEGAVEIPFAPYFSRHAERVAPLFYKPCLYQHQRKTLYRLPLPISISYIKVSMYMQQIKKKIKHFARTWRYIARFVGLALFWWMDRTCPRSTAKNNFKLLTLSKLLFFEKGLIPLKWVDNLHIWQSFEEKLNTCLFKMFTIFAKLMQLIQSGIRFEIGWSIYLFIRVAVG